MDDKILKWIDNSKLLQFITADEEKEEAKEKAKQYIRYIHKSLKTDNNLITISTHSNDGNSIRQVGNIQTTSTHIFILLIKCLIKIPVIFQIQF